MANIPFYILFGKKNDNYFYIANTNPVIWAVDIRKVKPFMDRYSAEYAVLRDYDNYQAIKANLNNGRSIHTTINYLHKLLTSISVIYYICIDYKNVSLIRFY